MRPRTQGQPFGLIDGAKPSSTTRRHNPALAQTEAKLQAYKDSQRNSDYYD